MSRHLGMILKFPHKLILRYDHVRTRCAYEKSMFHKGQTKIYVKYVNACYFQLDPYGSPYTTGPAENARDYISTMQMCTFFLKPA